MKSVLTSRFIVRLPPCHVTGGRNRGVPHGSRIRVSGKQLVNGVVSPRALNRYGFEDVSPMAEKLPPAAVCTVNRSPGGGLAPGAWPALWLPGGSTSLQKSGLTDGAACKFATASSTPSAIRR